MLDNNLYAIRSERTRSPFCCSYHVKVGEVPGLTAPSFPELPAISFPASPLQNAERALFNAKSVLSNPAQPSGFQDFQAFNSPGQVFFVKKQQQQPPPSTQPQQPNQFFARPPSQPAQIHQSPAQPQWQPQPAGVNFVSSASPQPNLTPGQGFNFQNSASPVVSPPPSQQPQIPRIGQQRQQQPAMPTMPAMPKASQPISFNASPSASFKRRSNPQQGSDLQYVVERAIAESSNPRMVNTQEKRRLLENLVSAGTSPAGAVEGLIRFGESNPTLLYEYSEQFKRLEADGHDKRVISVLMGEFYPDEGTVKYCLDMYGTLYREFGIIFPEFHILLMCAGVDINEARTYANIINSIKVSNPSCTIDDIVRGLRKYGVKI